MDTANINYLSRFSQISIAESLADTPVVMLVGPRGCGKTILVRQFISEIREYVTLDDEETLEAARYDPTGFLRKMDLVIIDEVQRVPDLLLAIKQAVEDDGRPGRFLLTSSTNVGAMEHLSESLADHMEIITLLPISRAEIEGKRPSFLSAAFSGAIVEPPFTLIGGELIQSVVAGGYPEMQRRKEPRRQAWARDYAKDLVQWYVSDVAGVEKIDQFTRLIEILATHSGQLINFSQIGSELGIDAKTTQKYTAILEQLFLVQRIPAWFQSRLNRLVKTPKLHFLDSGLHAGLLGLTAERVARNRHAFGALLETFVLSEIMKQTSWSDEVYAVNHYRDKDRDGVAFMVEDEGGALIGIDLKPAATVYAADFKGLRKVQSNCGDKLKVGIVLYDGTKTVAFGDRLFAAPISCLWGGTSAGG